MTGGSPYDMDSAGQRVISGVGRDLTVRTYEQVGEDDYGPNWDSYAGSPYTVTGYLNYGSGNAETVRTSRGNEVPRDVVVYLPTDFAAISEIRDGGHEGSIEIVVDGREFVVVSTSDEFDGMLSLQCTEVDNL